MIAVGVVEADVQKRVLEGNKVLRAVSIFLKSRTMSKGVKATMYQQLIVPTVTYGAETWWLREAERRRLKVFEIKCLRPMVGVTRWDRFSSLQIRRRAGIEEPLSETVDKRVLRYFGYVERMDEECWPRKVEAAKVV